MDLKELLTIEKCDCGREYCDYFGGGIGENGASYSQEELEEMLRDTDKLREHIFSLLSGKR